ncbi:hypothetical protein [Erythrobacter phage vB_EliS-L02]|nr:hypothetical protein [Erythrobacter phage vB_EliS-L02]
MAKMNTRHRYMFDAASAATLIAKDGVAKTANFNGALTLDQNDGHWNTEGELADQTLAIVVNVTAITAAAYVATITLDTVIATDAVTLDDGVNTPVTLVADTDFNVGADDAATAANLAEAINTTADLDMTATAAGAVVTVTNTLGFNADATITTSDATITIVDFAGGEGYDLAIQTGPVGFASNTVLGNLPVNAVGQYVFLLDLDTARAVKSDTAAIRIVGTVEGDSPSITLHSWIAGIQH